MITPEIAQILGPIATVSIVAIYLLVQHRSNNRRGNPGSGVERRLDTIIEKLDEANKTLAILKDRGEGR